MISAYSSDGGRLVLIEPGAVSQEKAVWFDLLTPTMEEEAIVEQALGIGVPLREEMEEIELSSRLYYEDGAAYMTATLPALTDTDEPQLAPVTFVLTGERLVTVRYHEPHAFLALATRAQRIAMGCNNGESVLTALLEIQVDRLADVLERISREVAQISKEVFQQRGSKPSRSSTIQTLLEAIGRKGDMTSNILECLGSLGRMIGFFGQVTLKDKAEKELRVRVRTLSRDCQSITDHAGFMTQKVTFLLDATLGLINIEQNAIIKIFSVVAVVFLPPTLIASIYGMNFQFMPELSWPFGYPLAMLLMVLSAISPFWFFRRRGWL